MWFLSCRSFYLVIGLLSEWSIENTHSVRSILQIKLLAWNLWLNTNTWVVLLMKPKALTLVKLINYINNYIKIIYLTVSWYYLLAPVANHWKQTHLERNVPVPLEQSFFYQIHTLITGKRSILAKMGTFFWKITLFLKEGPQKFNHPIFNSFSKCFASN